MTAEPRPTKTWAAGMTAEPRPTKTMAAATTAEAAETKTWAAAAATTAAEAAEATKKQEQEAGAIFCIMRPWGDWAGGRQRQQPRHPPEQ